MNIYVGNLSYQVTEDDLKSAFEAYGEVDSAKIITDRYTGNSKGFGFVEMPNDEEAEAAMEALNGQDMKGREVVVNKARPKNDDRRGGGHRGGHGGGHGGGHRRH